ncbi:hypothetical protein Ddye_001573 [Dipteronia dyeriana]|uniref:Uncharacterized protein n=1 Tax=Dipteronia dyeriana TaxID=168575 RepID=A0AAD9XNS1_9ROSI|nr:hypothetical protein Ddye_001573 [Dipteronia dyeriana]
MSCAATTLLSDALPFLNIALTPMESILVDPPELTSPIQTSQQVMIVSPYIGDGSKKISITKVTCGPGHGISVGSLGKYNNEEPVVGVTVRIKT